MRSPPRQQQPPNRRLAAQAGKASALIDAMLQLKESALAVGVHVIADRRAAQPDGVRENLAQSQPQCFQLRLAQPACEPPRTNAGAKKALVGVDVAHAGEQPLVEQGRLDGGMPGVEDRIELLRRGQQRICLLYTSRCV